MLVRRLTDADLSAWCLLRQRLWPMLTLEEVRVEQAELLAAPETNAVFLATHEDGMVVGFAEFSIRDWAEGCDSRNVFAWCYTQSLLVLKRRHRARIVDCHSKRVLKDDDLE